jgi:ribosomal protein S18 acetylase RimI-like enzyme
VATIRELDRKRDRKGVEAIDTAFETSSIFDVVTTPRAIELVERPLAAPMTKRYSISEVFQPWASWEVGWVADEDGIRGFATAQYEAWHHRLVLWFLYIAPEWRRRGIGRALLERVEAYGREQGATHVWLETSNVNVPGVAAYERLGYALAGVDTRYYGAYMPGETAIHLAKTLRGT